MSSTQRIDTALGLFFDRHLRNVHTGIRCEVVGVDYSGPTVDVKPFAHTNFGDGTIDAYPVILDVPLHLPSGNKGKARLAIPIKVGDIVGLNFSERNEDDSSDVTTHGLFPGWAVTEIYTPANTRPIDPDNVVLENEKAIVTLKPDGTSVITSGKAVITVQPDGNVVANGATITLDGDVVTSDGISLRAFWNDYLAHRHGGVERGGAQTDVKS